MFLQALWKSPEQKSPRVIVPLYVGKDVGASGAEDKDMYQLERSDKEGDHYPKRTVGQPSPPRIFIISPGQYAVNLHASLLPARS